MRASPCDISHTQIAGFFNETCTRSMLSRHPFQPALLVDMDADLYVSTYDALQWMLRAELLVPGTFVRYDDWPTLKRYPNASAFGGQTRLHMGWTDTPKWKLFGQALAHRELTERFQLTWREWGAGTYLEPVFQLVGIGPRGRRQFYRSQDQQRQATGAALAPAASWGAPARAHRTRARPRGGDGGGAWQERLSQWLRHLALPVQAGQRHL